MQIGLVDLKTEYKLIQQEINQAITGVLESANYILGPKVKQLETDFSGFSQRKYGVAVASGTDALFLAILASGIKPGDEIITTASTFIATAEAIRRAGAKPVFADIDLDTYCINPKEIRNKISQKTKMILPVHLYGQPCDMNGIMKLAQENGLSVIEDCAQATGAEFKDRKVGAFGLAGCFSFFPTKNLGGYGDGGMVVTDDENLASKVKLLRNHGAKDKYHHSIHGFNSRLDELQAAILLVKLKYIEKNNQLRRKNTELLTASLLSKGLDKYLKLPQENKSGRHVYHLFAVRTEKRDGLNKFLAENGITTLIHYPVALHLEEAYLEMGIKQGTLPNSEILAEQEISLPMNPYLTQTQIDYLAQTIAEYYETK